MRIIFLICFVLILGCKPKNKDIQKEVNVLFIGNSLTYYHDMPETLQFMLNEKHQYIKIDQITFPGISLNGHINYVLKDSVRNIRREKKPGEVTATEKKINEKKWDIVILQEGTVRLLIPETREFLVNPAIEEIIKLVNNIECRFLLFNTWPSKKDYPSQYCYPSLSIDESIKKDKCCSVEIQNLTQEIELINKAYDDVAKLNNIRKTDNGTLFYNVINNYPEINLYDDPIHPSKLGAFLNACVFYKEITGETASSINYVGEIDYNVSVLIKGIVDNHF